MHVYSYVLRCVISEEVYVIILLHHRCSFWVPIYHYRHHHQVKTYVRFACGVLLLKASLVFSCVLYVAHLNYLKKDTYMYMNILFLTLIFFWLFGYSFYYTYNIIQYFVALCIILFFSTLFGSVEG